MLTADAPNINIKLNSVLYKGEITTEYGLFTIQQVYVNMSDTTANVTLRFPVQHNSTVTSFDIISKSKRISSSFTDKNNAEDLSHDAIMTGYPSELFTIEPNGPMIVSIGKLESKEEITISVTYLQKLSNGVNTTHLSIPAAVKYAEADTEIRLHLYMPSRIADICSPNYEVTFNNSIISYSGYCNNKDVVLHITQENSFAPAIYSSKGKCVLSLCPKFEALQRPAGFDYIFIIDISDSTEGHIFEKMKSALLACLSGLQKGDTFNIIAVESICHYYSLCSQPYSPSTMKSASRWVSTLEPMGNAKLSEALDYAYGMSNDNSLLFVVSTIVPDDYIEILQQVKNQNRCRLYAVGTNTIVQPFINDLAYLGNGSSIPLAFGDEFEDNILALFCKILTSHQKKVRYKTDAPLTGESEAQFDKVFSDEALLIPSEINFGVPKKATLFCDDFSQDFSVRSIQTWHITEYISAITKLNDMKSKISCGNSSNNMELLDKMRSLCIQNQIATDYSTMVMTVDTTSADGSLLKITIPVKRVKGKKPLSSPSEIVSIMSKMSYDGSIGDADDTAKNALTLFEASGNILLYRRHIRKAVAFLFNCIQEEAGGIINKNIINVFSLWLKHYPEDTLFAKRIEALVFMNRNLL